MNELTPEYLREIAGMLEKDSQGSDEGVQACEALNQLALDMEVAAGELRVPFPPESELVRRLLIANVLLRRANSDLLAHRK